MKLMWTWKVKWLPSTGTPGLKTFSNQPWLPATSIKKKIQQCQQKLHDLINQNFVYFSLTLCSQRFFLWLQNIQLNFDISKSYNFQIGDHSMKQVVWEYSWELFKSLQMSKVIYDFGSLH